MKSLVNLNSNTIMKFKHFKLPQSLLSQLNECTRAFHLVTVDDQNNFVTHICYPDELTEVAMLNYMEIQANALQERIRMKAIGNDPDLEEED